MRRPLWQRVLFWLVAGVFFVWQNMATYLWLGKNGTFSAAVAHLWQTMTADWMLLLILSDACIFSALALAWFYGDMRGRGYNRARSSALLLAALAIGSPVLLLYLALEKS